MDKITNDQELIDALNKIVSNPSGSERVIRLQWINAYFDAEFIKKCIEQLRISSALMSSLGENPNALETLGMLALYDLVKYNGYEIENRNTP